MKNEDCGVLYLSFGEQYRWQTAESIRSLRNYYFGSVAVVTNDVDQYKDNIDNLHVIEYPCEKFSLYIKTQMNKLTPYRKTLFLDSDTLVLNNIDDIWKNNNICVVVDFYKEIGLEKIGLAHKDEMVYTCKQFGGKPNFNTGMLFWESCRYDHFFSVWEKEWGLFKGCDQAAFNRAVYQVNPSISILPDTWNNPTHEQIITKQQKDCVKILHLCGIDKIDKLTNKFFHIK